MKFLQKFVTIIAGIVLLILLFVVFCICNPEVTKSLGEKMAGLSGKWGNTVEEKPANEETMQVENALDELADGVIESLETELILYEPPAENTLTIPEELNAYQGLETILEEAKEVDNSRLEEVKEYLGYGETGEGLDFSEKYYPYFAMLSDKEQDLYRQIYANALAGREAFAPVCEVDKKSLSDVMMAVTGDHPEVFWIECGYRCQYVPGGRVAQIELIYNDTVKNLPKAKQLFEEAKQRILAAAGNPQNGLDRMEAEKALEQTLRDYVAYKVDAPMNQSAYSAIVQGETVCAGYAKAFVILCRECDIPCYYCTGYAGQPHAWNIVYVDKAYRNVDVTWNDALRDSTQYFNKSDSFFARDHIRRDLSVKLPACLLQESEEEEPEENIGEYGIEVNLNSLEFDPNAYYGYNDTHTLRDLSDVGALEENVKTTLRDYYDACYEAVTVPINRRADFNIVVKDYQLMEDICNSYQNGSYEAAYGIRALRTIGATSWEIVVNVEALEGDYYLIMHSMTY